MINYAKALAMCGAGLIAGASILAAVTPVRAAPHNLTVVGRQSQYVTRYVSYADLNLASRPGERILYHRVGFAVNEVCTEPFAYDSSQIDDCTMDSWDRARPQIVRAVRRAREIAATGTSSITAAAAIAVDLRK